MTTKELQTNIKAVIRKLGWNQSDTARRIYCELNDTDNEDEILRFTEKFKKHLSRETTSPEKLKRYLDILRGLDETKRLGVVVPNHVPSGHLDHSLQNQLLEISKNLDRECRIDDGSEN